MKRSKGKGAPFQIGQFVELPYSCTWAIFLCMKCVRSYCAYHLLGLTWAAQIMGQGRDGRLMLDHPRYKV